MNMLEPIFVSNNTQKGTKVLTTLENELSHCDSFIMSVAFISEGGITPLLQTLEQLEAKGVQGRILTTDYLMFNDPKALEKVHSFSNIELKMFRCAPQEGYHPKGYLFEHDQDRHIMIGSSNLTLNALTKNKEWNTFVYAKSGAAFTNQVYEEFESLWNATQSETYDEFIETYRKQYVEAKMIQEKMPISKKKRIFLPNSMQLELIKSFMHSLRQKDDRGLLISATGTGKTYASAFAIREMKPRRMLFLVHREQIAKQAYQTYQNVLSDSYTFGLLSQNAKEIDADCLFSTMQMMSKPEIYSQFSKDSFDVIVIDEVHRAGANSYQTIMRYFTPKYWFGMTASPERSDDFDIYQLFHHNILHEIRLQQALEENLLCPFHYFGITDLEIDGQVLDDHTGLKNFLSLVCDERVDYILNRAQFYGYSGPRVKGLVFCSQRKEAEELSKKFNERGIRSACLFGSDSMQVREEQLERLVSDTREDYLEYIFTIDIFNEGIDIPEVNQILMLRPTQSSIIFIQQLGRGLRKYPQKEYVVIIDFIGNYKNNFLIPIALSGDRSYNKDTIRRYLQEGNRIIPGSSTIHFDEISKKRIYQAIDIANFNDIRLIKDSYQQLKYKLGRIPTLLDFDVYGSLDPVRIFENKSLGSYHMFLKKYEKEYTVRFDLKQEKVLEFISKKFGSGKRIHELLILQYLLDHDHGVFTYLKKALLEHDGIVMTEQTKINLVHIFTNQFLSGTGKDAYAECILIQEENDDYGISSLFKEMLQNQAFYQQVQELIYFGIHRNQTQYQERYEDTSFTLYEKYTYEDVCRLLEWSKSEVALNIGGYKYDKQTNTYPIFINYDKAEGIDASINYEDTLISTSELIAISKSGRSVQSEDVQNALHAQEKGIDMELFIRKNKDDKISKEFYYMGKIYPTGYYQEFTMPNTNKSAVKIGYHLQTPIIEELYDYIVGEA